MIQERATDYTKEAINLLGTINPPDENKKYSLYDTSEIRITLMALKTCLWSQAMAAKAVGVSPRTFNYKCSKFGISHPFWRADQRYDNVEKLQKLNGANGNGKDD